MKKLVVISTLFAGSFLCANCQIQRTSVPMKDALTKALQKSSLTEPGSQPFHIRISVSEPENPQSPYQGTIEEWWVSPQQWRREVVSKDGSHQTIVVAAGKKTEEDRGDYLPLWLSGFVTAAFDPVPDTNVWSASGMQIEQITMSNGARSDACARSQTKMGSGDRAADVFSVVCFDGEGRLKSYVSPRYGVEFNDYRRFGKKQVPEKFVDDPESGTTLVGAVTLLEEESKAANSANLFTPLSRDDNSFESVQTSPGQLEQLTADNPGIIWPAVRSGNVRGRVAVYISADRSGQVREVWPLNSDNGEISDFVREQVIHWKLKPTLDKDGNPVQIDGGLGFSFETKIGVPLPQLTDAQVRSLATRIVEPLWPADLKSGTVIEALVSVDQSGSLAGVSYHAPASLTDGVLAINQALKQWIFRPLIRDGEPQYFQGMVRFTVP